MNNGMLIIGKVGIEKVSLSGNLPEVNTLIADACMVPLLKDRKSMFYYSQYKAPANLKNKAYESWYKRVVHDRANHGMTIGFPGVYKTVPFIDDKVDSAFYFDGSYVNKEIDVKMLKEYKTVYSIYFNSGHKSRIEASAEYFGIEVDQWFNVDYGNYLDTNHRYLHGSKWLAACVGSSFSRNLVIPSTNDFWSTERSESIFSEGSDWISRYYGEIISLYNPVKKSKADILKATKGKYDLVIPCRCGRCMECITTYAVLNENLPNDFFKEDPRRDDERIRMLRSAVANNKTDEYRDFLEQ